MLFEVHSHRHAEAIIKNDPALSKRYQEFTDALTSITDEELINEYLTRKEQHDESGRDFKSITPSINAILKERMLKIPGWRAEVEIFNDETGEINNTEWRLDFACDDAFCIEVAFNHGEAIAWNLLKPVISCELNHVKKAVQGQLGIYVCATDELKKVGLIDSASGSYEKVLRYLPPMMNQLTIPMMIIGLEPFESFKINNNKEIVRSGVNIDENSVDKKVLITLKDGEKYRGKLIGFKKNDNGSISELTVEKSKNESIKLIADRIKFIEIKEES